MALYSLESGFSLSTSKQLDFYLFWQIIGSRLSVILYQPILQGSWNVHDGLPQDWVIGMSHAEEGVHLQVKAGQSPSWHDAEGNARGSR